MITLGVADTADKRAAAGLEDQECSLEARDGVRIAYRLLASPRANAVVVVVHGFALSSKDYVAFGKALAKQGLAVCLVDLRGHGRSEGVPGDVCYLGQLLDDLRDLIVYLRRRYQDLPVTLCSHSSASCLVVKLMTQPQPPPIDALFFIAPLFFADNLAIDRKPPRLQRVVHWLKYLRAAPPPVPAASEPAQRIRFFLWKYLIARLLPGFSRSMVLFSRSPGSNSGEMRFTFRFFETYRCASLRDRLARLDRPVFMCIGADDEYLQPDAVVALYNWNVPPRALRQVLRVKGASHFTILVMAPLIISRWIGAIVPAVPQVRV